MNFKKYISALLVTVITCLAVFGGASLARFFYGDSLADEIEKLLDKPVGKKINVLVMGLDEDKIRADTIMIVNINPEDKSIKLMSIPRDTKVHVGSSAIKINATMSYKSKEELMIQKLREVTGMPIHYYAEVDFSGFIKIVDILGGVDYNVPYPMNYDDPTQNLHIHLNPGMQHLNGKKAHDFVRFRQNNGGTAPGLYALGDEGRIQAQQDFLKEFVRQKLQPQYITKAPELIEEVYKYVKTNFTVADAIRYAGMLSKLDSDSFETFMLPGAGEYQGGVSYFIHNKEKTRELVYQEFGYLNGESVPLPPEPTPSAPAA
jgi:LCP family protein required for cell wall assembly